MDLTETFRISVFFRCFNKKKTKNHRNAKPFNSTEYEDCVKLNE